MFDGTFQQSNALLIEKPCLFRIAFPGVQIARFFTKFTGCRTLTRAAIMVVRSACTPVIGNFRIAAICTVHASNT